MKMKLINQVPIIIIYISHLNSEIQLYKREPAVGDILYPKGPLCSSSANGGEFYGVD